MSNDSRPKSLNIAFWRKSTGNAMSHRSGITADQVKAFKELEEGDQLILYQNDTKGKETSPNFSLRVFVQRPKGEGNDDSF